jgi:hypothetical protein
MDPHARSANWIGATLAPSDDAGRSLDAAKAGRAGDAATRLDAYPTSLWGAGTLKEVNRAFVELAVLLKTGGVGSANNVGDFARSVVERLADQEALRESQRGRKNARHLVVEFDSTFLHANLLCGSSAPYFAMQLVSVFVCARRTHQKTGRSEWPRKLRERLSCVANTPRLT